MSEEHAIIVDDQLSVGLPPRWSPSSLNTFLSCPLSYWWQYAQGWRSAPNAAMEAGTLVHGVLEDLMEQAPEERTVEHARETYRVQSAELREGLDPRVDADELRERAGVALTSYFEVEDPAVVEVVPDGLERKLATRIGGVTIAGSVDRIDFGLGGVRVLDYKTGGAKPRYASAYWRQVLLYARMVADEGLDVSEISLMYLGEPARVMTRPVPPSAAARVAGELERAAEDRESFDEESRWVAKTSGLCKYCPYRTVCPAWSRSPVPVPGSADSNRTLERIREVDHRPRPVASSSASELAQSAGKQDS
jgi:putative RecB family exonuclease